MYTKQITLKVGLRDNKKIINRRIRKGIIICHI